MPIASIAFLILVQSHVRSWCEVRWTTACPRWSAEAGGCVNTLFFLGDDPVPGFRRLVFGHPCAPFPSFTA